MSSIVTKVLSPAFYQQQYKVFMQRTYDYYHPLFRSGSATPLWHMMVAVSTIMYTTSYLARDYKNVQHRQEIQALALKEYYEKHGGAPDHH